MTDKTIDLLVQLAGMPDDEREALLAELPENIAEEVRGKLNIARTSLYLVPKARELTAEGFAAFHEGVLGLPILHHIKTGADAIFEVGETAAKAHEDLSPDDMVGTVIKYFRGSGKTTGLKIALSAFFIGHFPDKVGLFIQAVDKVAEKEAQKVANIVEYNPFFKQVFPNIVPDKDLSWSSDGYEVKRTDMEYPAWRALNAQRAGPSFIGMGYNSSALIGKRPFWFIADDINDENNTASDRERERVNKIFTETLLPASNHGKFRVVIGTPWHSDDVIHTALNTGLFREVSFPVYTEQPDGTRVYTWPEMFGENRVEQERKLAGTVGFARMYLLDLTAMHGQDLKEEWLTPYPFEDVNVRWPVYMGVDYASTPDEWQKPGRERDYYAIAIWRYIPGTNKMVLVDGYRGHVTADEADKKLRNLAIEYPTLTLVGVEMESKGEEFFHRVRRTTTIPLLECRTKGKSKGWRFINQMSPVWERRQAMIADYGEKTTPEFIKTFRQEWIEFPKGRHDDTLDAAFWGMYAASGVLIPSEAVDDEFVRRNPLFAKRNNNNPWASLGRR